MRIISFAWTSPALITGNKTCTRRAWTQEYANRIHEGDLMAAYNKNPRSGGMHIATIRLTAEPRTEWLRNIPDSDYEAEGFAWLVAHPEVLDLTIEGNPKEAWLRNVCTRAGFERWRASGGAMWVVRFSLVNLTAVGHELNERYQLVVGR